MFVHWLAIQMRKLGKDHFFPGGRRVLQLAKTLLLFLLLKMQNNETKVDGIY